MTNDFFVKFTQVKTDNKETKIAVCLRYVKSTENIIVSSWLLVICFCKKATVYIDEKTIQMVAFECGKYFVSIN